MGKLLVVDDDAALRRLMRVELGDTYEVVDSAEPEQGLAMALEHQPDAILLDLRMPKYSGYELLQTFTSFGHTQSIPVIIVSGEGSSQTKETCKQLGAAAYFDKPIDFDGLRSCLQQIAKPRHRIAISEVRVPLSVHLKLRGKNFKGDNFDVTAKTVDASVNGFLCTCNADLPIDSIVDVYLVAGGEEHVGKAKIVDTSSKHAFQRNYRCRFIEQSGPWVLR
jgi:CheY-like chemotaxis protein